MSILDQIKTFAPFGAVPEIDPDALHDALASAVPPVLLDVRTRLEWQTSRIPGALSVPIVGIAERLETLVLATDRPIIAICLSAHRSIPAVRLLRERGFEHVMQLQGGMLAWWARKLPTVSGEEP